MSELRFHGYTLNHTERVLRFGTEIVPLPPRAIELLAILAASPNAVVSKDRLMSELWGDVPVEEGNLTQLVFRLRKAFSQLTPDVRIETIPRRGYRMVVPRESAPIPVPTARKKPWLPLAAGGLVLLVAVSATAAGNHQPVRVRDDVQLGYATWFNAKSLSDVQRSIAYFEEAVHQAPRNAEARAGLADALVSRALRESNTGQVVADADSALDNAHQAVLLDPANADARAALGQAQAVFGDARFAEAELRRAVSLDPQSVEARTWYGELLLSKANLQQAAEQFRAALATSSSWTEAGDDLALISYLQRRYAEAQAYARESLIVGPLDRTASLFLALSESIRQPGRAEDDVRSMLEHDDGSNALAEHALLGYFYARTGDSGLAVSQIGKVKALIGRARGVSDPFTIISLAATYALQHRRDDAFVWLARLSKTDREIFSNDSRLDAVRNDARFTKWLQG
ncbi:MAG TPA: winged helix-turn-helix domain-containing protein [Candidatus Baltobacteraceae bacterium]|jgi:DNA-binding winged helix-turn-helix (wHTH) protein|nr:winged helix-turn-helix domain-containing protein [Candidatus Baltobacteraceae bacterium]